MANKYKYDDWWNGEVILVHADIYNLDKHPVKVDWSDFKKSDIEKIKNKQSELFNSGWNRILSEHQRQFLIRRVNSKMPALLLKKEIEQCKSIMEGAIPVGPSLLVPLKHWPIILDKRYLEDIQLYIGEIIINGIDDDLGFIHSPNSKYQDSSKPDKRVYARFVLEYYNWLISLAAEEHQPNKAKNDIKIKEKENTLWFKIGLLFANGEMDKLIAKYKNGTMSNSTKIAKELGNKNYRPYISESTGAINKNNKNIFSNTAKIDFIEEYCKKHNITIVDSFKELKKATKKNC